MQWLGGRPLASSYFNRTNKRLTSSEVDCCQPGCQEGLKPGLSPALGPAWKQMDNTMPDLILLDILLPGIDGIELLRPDQSHVWGTNNDDQFESEIGC